MIEVDRVSRFRANQRLAGLDILRAVAILLVIGHHMAPCPASVSRFWNALTEALVHGGWIGVDIFFVLSGFLVSGLLFREYLNTGTIAAGRFLIRRGFKIYPAFWAMILTTIVIKLVHHEAVDGGHLLRELLFVQNYGPGLWMHTWSLAVEEHFYLLLVLFVFFLPRRNDGVTSFRMIPAVFVGIVFASFILRLASQEAIFLNPRVMFQTQLRLDGLFCGVLISYWYHFRHEVYASWVARLRPWFLGLGGTFLLRYFLPWSAPNPLFASALGFVPAYVGAALMLLALLDLNTPRLKLVEWFAHVGRHSYSIYLWHVMLLGLVWGLFRKFLPVSESYSLYFVLCYGVCLFVGIAMALLIEVPILRIRERYFPARRHRASVVDDSVELVSNHSASVAPQNAAP